MGLRFTLLGGYVAAGCNGERIQLKTKKSWALLTLLIQSKTGQCTRGNLAALLWPRSGEEQARASLRQELAVLRKLLVVDGAPLLEAKNDTIGLHRDQIEVDSLTLERVANSKDPLEVRRIPEIYKGELVSGLNIRSTPFDDWLWLERQRLRELAIAALERVLSHESTQGDPQITLDTAQAILDIDSTHEPAQRDMMQSLHKLGRRAEALAQFTRIQEVMRRELDTEPSKETSELYYRLRDQTSKILKDDPYADPDAIARQEKRELTFMAFGVANPTNQLELLGAEDVSELLVGMEDICRDIVPKFGGTLLGMMGDRCLAVFGYPTTSESMTERAVFAARELVSQTLALPGKGTIQLNCGIATGETLIDVCDTGVPQLSHFSGAAIAQACSFSFMATGGQILIGSKTRALVRRAFKTEQIISHGYNNLAFQIIGEKSAQNRFDISEISNTLSLLTGRDAELDQLAKHWDRVRQGEGTTAAVTGEPGIGKSRLIHAFLRTGLKGRTKVFKFCGSLHHQNTAFYPVAQEFRRIAQVAQSSERDDLRDMFLRWLDGYGIGPDDNIQKLAFLLETDAVPDWDDARPEQPTELLISCIKKVAEKAPVVLVFEDYHWMDSSTQKLLCELFPAIRTSRVFIVVTNRPELNPAVLDMPSDHQIKLGRLSKAQTRDMALQICPPHLDGAQVSRIIELSDGIPLFLEELVNFVPEREDMISEYTQQASIPASLQETLMARIDRMGDEKEILHIAAVIGREFSHPLLQTVTQYDDEHVALYLETLQSQDLIYRIGPLPYARYEFKHALVQELTYKSILKKDRRRYHAQIAQTLAAGDAQVTSPEPELIAWHFEKCGKFDEALEFLEAAGRQAVSVSAHYEATQHFRHALKLARSRNNSGKNDDVIRRILLLLGPQLLAEHGFASDEVKEVYRHAESLSSDTDSKPTFSRILWGLWSNCVVGADLEAAGELSEEYLKIALGSHETLDTIAAHYMTGVSRFYTGMLEEAGIAFERARKKYKSALHDEMVLRFGFNLEITSSSYLLWIYTLSGRFDDAHALSNQLIEHTEHVNHSVSTGFAHNFISGMYNFMGKGKQAAHHASVAAALSDGQRFAQFRAQANINLGRALDLQGQSRGLGLLQEGLDGYLETGAELARPYAHAWLAEAYMKRGLVGQAEASIAQALKFSARTAETYYDAELLRLQAELSSQSSFTPEDKIVRLFESSIYAADRSGARAISLMTSASFSRFLKHHKRHDAAHHIAKKELSRKAIDDDVPLYETAKHELLRMLD